MPDEPSSSGSRPEKLFDPDREVAVDPKDAVVVAHRFLARCRAWGAEREIPARIERLRSDPSPEAAAKLHAWTSWVAFVDHAMREVESGALDHWFADDDGL